MESCLIQPIDSRRHSLRNTLHLRIDCDFRPYLVHRQGPCHCFCTSYATGTVEANSGVEHVAPHGFGKWGITTSRRAKIIHVGKRCFVLSNLVHANQT